MRSRNILLLIGQLATPSICWAIESSPQSNNYLDTFRSFSRPLHAAKLTTEKVQQLQNGPVVQSRIQWDSHSETLLSALADAMRELKADSN